MGMVTDTAVMTIWLLGNSPWLHKAGIWTSGAPLLAQDIPRASVPHVMRRHRAKTLGTVCSKLEVNHAAFALKVVLMYVLCPRFDVQRLCKRVRRTASSPYKKHQLATTNIHLDKI